jgi:hypothetical protein
MRWLVVSAWNMVLPSGVQARPLELVMPPDQAWRSLPRSSTYISAAGLSRGSYMVPTQKRPAGSTRPSLKRMIAVS